MDMIKKLIISMLFTLPLVASANTILPTADEVLVVKSKRKMYLIRQGAIYQEYRISLGDSPVGHKGQEGDKRTPEGRYIIDYRNPESRFHLSLHINYPSELDMQSAADNGVSPGGEIFIHGLPNGMEHKSIEFKGRDWTDGCIAITNKEITEFWTLVKDGTPIVIKP
ncbi:murein L,D-transpeptidase family protein [Psychromonas sp.]|uniref:L,D-transpeptidase family protein n=1 Tax=Psychromonas sp. TaxID=1884585 RepID=UPI003567D004